MKDFMTLGHSIAHEVIINKSRFIGLTYPVTSEDDIAKCLGDARLKYPNASHYCYGYILGNDGLLQRFSDDGEPGGTAGMPIMQVLLQQELRDVLIVVVRYFGGIKLGAGGLVRAYTKTAVEAIDKADRIKMTYSSKGIISIDYHLLGSVEHYLRQDGILILEITYQENVQITIITNIHWDEVCNRLTDICSGNINIEEQDSVYYHWILDIQR